MPQEFSTIYGGLNSLDENEIRNLLTLIGNTGKHFISISFLKYIDDDNLEITYNDCYVKGILNFLNYVHELEIINSNGITIDTREIRHVSRYTYDDNNDLTMNFSRMNISSDGYRKPTKDRAGKSKGKSKVKSKGKSKGKSKVKKKGNKAMAKTPLRITLKNTKRLSQFTKSK